MKTQQAKTQQALQTRQALLTDHAELDHLRERLLAQAFLFDHPRTYEAGVEDTLEALQASSAAREPQPA